MIYRAGECFSLLDEVFAADVDRHLPETFPDANDRDQVGLEEGQAFDLFFPAREVGVPLAALGTGPAYLKILEFFQHDLGYQNAPRMP